MLPWFQICPTDEVGRSLRASQIAAAFVALSVPIDDV